MVTLSEALKTLSKNHDSKILDFGCGDGREMESMRKIGCANIIGFDVARWSPNAP